MVYGFMEEREGVVKFNQVFTKTTSLADLDVKELNICRGILHAVSLIGKDFSKYGGAGYGNVSQRIKPFNAPRNKRKFIITGTQTGGIETLTKEQYTIVNEYYFEKNLVVSEGSIEASSESMTHGAVYDQNDSIKFVFHVHSPQIWVCADKLEIPKTDENILYGTPEMAVDIGRLFRETDVFEKRIFVMAGHKDGIITFGSSSEEAGLVMLKYLVKSLRLL